MATDLLLEHVREQYHAEIQRKDTLIQRAGISAAILLLEGNIIVSLAREFAFIPPVCWHLLFYLPAIIGILFCIIAGIQLGYAIYLGGIYTYLPNTEDIKTYLEKLNSVGRDDAYQTEKLKNNLISVYSFCATHNSKLNTKRNGRITRSIKFSIVSFILLIASLPAYYVMSKSFPSQTTQVEITTPITIKP